ncbi:MAG: hypothetical protein J7559_06230 [Cohnella sp.]|nr:hypothetical protein [Cohnella sp.]
MQSKAKNEVLSLITAYQNPIDFSDRLYLYYAFVYFCILVPTVILTGIYLFGGLFILRKFKPTNKSVRVAQFLLVLVWYGFGGIATWFFIKAMPFIPYYLFYASKNPSSWEMFIKYLFLHQELPWVAPSFDYDSFQSEVLISLQSGNMLIVVLIFFFIEYKRYFKNKEIEYKILINIAKSELLFAMYDNHMPKIIAKRVVLIYQNSKAALSNVFYTGLGLLILFVFLLLFVTHTAYQLGSFGKNLAQFDTDYVTVEYQFNNQIQKVEGIRVYQDKNYLVIRDDHNIIHSIIADQIHVQTNELTTD